MHMLFLEGRSWPGGLEGGRFNFARMPMTVSEVEIFLEKGLRLDWSERSLIREWGEYGPGLIDDVGANVVLMKCKREPSDLGMLEKLAARSSKGQGTIVLAQEYSRETEIPQIAAALQGATEGNRRSLRSNHAVTRLWTNSGTSRR